MTDHRHHTPPPGFDETAVFDAAFWDARYASAPAMWSGHPNPQLVVEATPLTPGRALDVGAGEGADAVWLAERGWTVTALDISQVALDRAAAHAASLGAAVAERISWEQADLNEAPILAGREGSFDLVSAQFMHLPANQREPVYRRLAALVAPGGRLLVVGHHQSDLETAPHMRPRRPDLIFTAEEIAALLDAETWQILISESRDRSIIDPDGVPTQVADAVLVARRSGN